MELRYWLKPVDVKGDKQRNRVKEVNINKLVLALDAEVISRELPMHREIFHSPERCGDRITCSS